LIDTFDNKKSSSAINNGKNIVIKGEVIISTDAAIKNSRIYKTSLAQEVVLYIIHGILHLIGYDDCCGIDISKMRKKEEETLNLLSRTIEKVIS